MWWLIGSKNDFSTSVGGVCWIWLISNSLLELLVVAIKDRLVAHDWFFSNWNSVHVLQVDRHKNIFHSRDEDKYDILHILMMILVSDQQNEDAANNLTWIGGEYHSVERDV